MNNGVFLKFNFNNKKILVFIFLLFSYYLGLMFYSDIKINKNSDPFYLLIISLAFVLFVFTNKKTLNNRLNNGKLGRRLVLITFSLVAIRAFFLIFNQEYSYIEIFTKLSSELPVFCLLLLLKDFISIEEENKEKTIKDKVNKKYNWSDKRIKERSFSFNNVLLHNNGLNPILSYILIVFYSIIIINIYFLNINIIYSLILILILYLFFVKKEIKLIYKFKSLIALTLCLGLSFVFCNIYYKNITNPLEELDSGNGNNTYAKTRIGNKDPLKGDFQKLLFRANWKDRTTNLLPTSFYNFFNERDNSWLLSSKLKNYEIAKGENNTINLKPSEDLKVASFDFIKIENLNDFLISKKEVVNNPNYSYKNIEKDPKLLSIIGSFGKEDKNTYPIPLPYNSLNIMSENINDRPLYQYTSGSVSVLGNTGFKEFNMFYKDYGNNQYDLVKPIQEDLSYPKIYQEDIVDLIKKVNIKEEDDTDVKVKKLVDYFQNNYLYTLNTNYKNTEKARNLSDFLIDDQRGHCEYFATAMTLSLRELGIPARYTVGFLVSEVNKEEGEDLYWVRSKDAHAWTTYWNGQAWKTADATPYNSEEFNQFGKASYLKDKIEELKFIINNINFDFEEYIDLIIGFCIFVFLSFFVIMIVMRKKEFNQVFIKDPNLNKFKRKIKKYEKIYPNDNKDLYLTWALKTKDEALINLVKKYYKRYE